MTLFRQIHSHTLNKYDLITGHIPYCYLENLTDFKKFTIFRDPITRTVSEYNHLMHMPTLLRQANILKQNAYTFQDFIKSDIPRVKVLTNVYTTYLGDKDGVRYEIKSFFKRAMDRISKFDFIGIYEHFEKTIELIKKQYGLNGNFKTKGVTPKKYKTEITDEDIEVAREVLQPDLTLYKFALEQFGGQ